MSNSSVPISSSFAPSTSFQFSSSAGAPSTAVVTVSAPSSAPVSTVLGSSQTPTDTALVTSIITQSATNGQPSATQVVISTSFITTPPSSTAEQSRTASASSSVATSSTPASLTSNSSSNSSKGLSPAGVTAIAVVIPVVVVALLLLAGIFWWRKRKQKKTAREARRMEVEEYGYNPNEDPTLPAVAGTGSESPEMSQDTAGYRGWGNNAAGSSNRKPSTNLSSGIGMAVSDDGQRGSPSSPGNTDGGHSGDPLVDGAAGAGAGAVGAGTAAAHHTNGNNDGVQRGPSNASSSYSNAGRTDNSDDGQPGDYGYENNYSQYAPYRPGATQYDESAQPVIRDVQARRATRIENPSTLPKQGNSGISQNF